MIVWRTWPLGYEGFPLVSGDRYPDTSVGEGTFGGFVRLF